VPYFKQLKSQRIQQNYLRKGDAVNRLFLKGFLTIELIAHKKLLVVN